MPPLLQGLDQAQHAGRLPGAAHGEVAHADHRRIEAALVVKVTGLPPPGALFPNASQQPADLEPRHGRPVMRQVRPEKFADGFHGSGCSAAAGLSAGHRTAADLAGAGWAIEQRLDSRRQLFAARNFHKGPGIAELIGDVTEVLHVRPDDHGLRKERRFEDVVAAASGHRAAHKDDVGQREESAELSDRIDQETRAAVESEGSAVRRTYGMPAASSFCATRSKRSGLRGTSNKSKPGWRLRSS